MGPWTKTKNAFEWLEHARTLWEIILALGGGTVIRAILLQFTRIPPIWVTPLWLISSGVLLWLLTKIVKGTVQEQKQAVVAQTSTSLAPQVSPVDFDAATFFRQAYHSDWTADIENRIRIAARQSQPNDVESFYSRFIGVGYVACWHDATWLQIYKSQVLMLQELNRRNGMMPGNDAKPYYDGGKQERPEAYTNYSLDNWLQFLQARKLVIRHPSDMLEITIGGKDFLKYMTHFGLTVEGRKG